MAGRHFTKDVSDLIYCRIQALVLLWDSCLNISCYYVCVLSAACVSRVRQIHCKVDSTRVFAALFFGVVLAVAWTMQISEYSHTRLTTGDTF